MNAQVACYGRLGRDPEMRTSQSGKEWCSASIAVDASLGQDDPPLWLKIVCFGRVAETLAKHQKGDLLSVSGRLEVSRWTDREGKAREQLQVIADTVISARTVRPGGGRKRQADPDPMRQGPPDRMAAGGGPLDDEFPFGPEVR